MQDELLLPRPHGSDGRLYQLTGCAVLAVLATACATAPPPPEPPPPSGPVAPVAERIPHVTKVHDTDLVDPYFWLREKDNPKVIAYLEAENRYTDEMMTHTSTLQKALYEEMLARIKEDDRSVPARKDEYFYYSRTETGRPYPIYCRKKGSLEADEEILLDVNSVAEGKEYTRLGNFGVSPDHQLLGYSVDHSGNERFTLMVKDLSKGALLEDKIEETYYSMAWASDNKTIFYCMVVAANRPYQVYRHVIGSPSSEDALVFEEKDERFFVSIERSRSGAYIFVNSESAITTEVRFLDAKKPTGEFTVIHPRQQGMEYYVDHHGNRFFIRTNDQAINFKLVEAPVRSPGKKRWKTVIAHREDITLTSILAFKNYLVVFERAAGLPQILVRPLKDPRKSYRIELDEATYTVWPEDNREFDSSELRFGFSSLLTPESIFDYDMKKKTKTLKKQEPVIGYDREKYESERFFATASDGTKVPISVVFKKGVPKDGSAPLLLNGYGSYGYPYEPYFRSEWVSLLDRGVIVAIGHIRGGGEMGRRWKEDGKFEKKVNTFTDFIACAEHLIKEGYTSANRLAISGRSAGGLLIGAVINMRPDLFRAAVAGVPFVDVLNTMLDETIPLTVIEWEEWGNPNEAGPFATIKAYSPYDNVKAQNYPNLLILAGLNDPRVAYWEPAKWTAKLRATKTGDEWLLLKTNMGAGHGGKSGRYGRLEDRAFEWAFLLDRLGVR